MGIRSEVGAYNIIHDAAINHFVTDDEIKWDATGATNFLWSRFGVSEQVLKQLFQDYRKLLTEAGDNKWDGCLSHPEYALSLLMSGYGTRSDRIPPELRQETGTRSQHPLNLALLEMIWTQKRSVKSGKNKEKGNWLERLMIYLFSTLDGVRTRHSFLPDDRTSEIDLLVECLPHAAQWLRARLGNRILVECKHRVEKLASKELFSIAAKMKYHGCDSGIVVSTGGFTGEEEKQASLAVAMLNQHNAKVLLIDCANLERTRSCESFQAYLLDLCDSQWDRHRY